MINKLDTQLSMSEHEAYYFVKDKEAEKELIAQMQGYGIAVFFPDYGKIRTYPAFIGQQPVQITTNGTCIRLTHFTSTEFRELCLETTKKMIPILTSALELLNEAKNAT